MSSAEPSASASGGLRPANVNLGVLGHVDSGKTSLVAALSTTLSTAALDKSPQSKSRGITLDLGLSAFTLPMPARLAAQASQKGYNGAELRCTLVDCPGHASLIRTIIGGASIIDMAVLVVDVVKGFQAQTSECLVLAEICCRDLVVVLNKVDAVPAEARDATVRAAVTKVTKTLEKTRFAGAPVVATAAAPAGVRAQPGAEADRRAGAATTDARDAGSRASGNEDPGSAGAGLATATPLGIDELLATLGETIRLPQREAEQPFLYAIDHCFSLRGRGTILAGTVLRGRVAVGDDIEVVHLRQTRRVRSLQIFREGVEAAVQGDRVAINVPSLNAKQIERGLASAPGHVPQLRAAVVLLRKVRFHRRDLESGRKLHVSVGHLTVMATCYYYGAVALALHGSNGSAEAPSEEAKIEEATASSGANLSAAAAADIPHVAAYDWDRSFEWSDGLFGAETVDDKVTEAARMRGEDPVLARHRGAPLHWAFVIFDSPVPCPVNSLFIASRLDLDEDTGGSGQCRLATYGRIVEGIASQAPSAAGDAKEPARASAAPRLPRLFKWKTRRGRVGKVTDGGVRNGEVFTPVREFLVTGMFANGAAVVGFQNCVVVTGRGMVGRIVTAFGTSGDARVQITAQSLGCAPPAPEAGAQVYQDDLVYLRFKKFMKVGGKLPFLHQPASLFPSGAVPVVFQEEDSALLPLELRQSADIPAEEEAAGPRRRDRGGRGKAAASEAEEPVANAGASPALEAEADAKAAALLRTGTISTFRGDAGAAYMVAIVQGAFTPAEDIRAYIGSPATLKKHEGRESSDIAGALEGPFAKSGKCKVRFPMAAAAQLGDEVCIQLADDDEEES